MKFLFVLLSILFIRSDGGEISQLKSNPVPEKEDVKNFKNWSTYVVSIKNGKAIYDFNRELWKEKKVKLNFEIDRSKEKEAYFSSPKNALKVDNGWLVGFDRGEWGGALYWYNEDGTTKYLICDGNVHNIIELNKKIYITQGLAHLASEYGNISEIKFNNKWEKSNSKKLSGCPWQSVVYKDKILLITSEDIVLLNKSLKITEKFENGYFEGLYPNSVIIDNEIAYFGMRGGILKLNIETKKQEWLTE